MSVVLTTTTGTTEVVLVSDSSMHSPARGTTSTTLHTTNETKLNKGWTSQEVFKPIPTCTCYATSLSTADKALNT